MAYVIQRGKWLHFKRRIPELYRHLYNEEFVQVSLKTDSMRIAELRSNALNSELENIWARYGRKNQSMPEEEFDKAVRFTRMGGFDLRSTQEIAQQEDLEILLSRINTVKHDIGKESGKVSAILGGHDNPILSISKTLEHYFEFEKPNLLNKTDDQIRKWKNPRKRAIKNFIHVCGDKDISTITRGDILDFRQWWFERIKEQGLKPHSSNKDFSHLGQILKYAKDDKRIDINVTELLARVRLTETESTRPPFKTDYIKDTLLSADKLTGLNDECRLFLFAMADTGARPSELIGLNAENGDIRLDTTIPYIFIRPDKKRELKTAQSKRKIPLVGASLYAFENLPEGFLRYYRKPDLLSATLNKYLRDNDLLPTEEHVVYSLRHSFEDRLTAVEPPEKVQAALMGHKYSRERYGDGPSLEQKKEWLDKICFNVSEQ